MSDICEVCEGSGEYPIHARGKHVYDITCPECGGDGSSAELELCPPMPKPVSGVDDEMPF